MTTETQPMDGWNTIAWKQVEYQVFKLQKRIFKAEQRDDVKTVRDLQRLLMKSRSAKLLAVRRVTQDNQGKKTAGVDGVKSLTPNQRLALSQRLQLTGRAKPARRIWIPKPGSSERRPLGIPVMEDRAAQALVKVALEPEWEARFEPNSYGFRPGRSAWDAIEAIHTAISTKAKWVLDADIAKCYDRINHQALLDKLNACPRVRRQIKAWLTSGVIDQGQLFPTAQGTPQGGVLSPLLANIALHGLETAVRTAGDSFRKKNFRPPIVIRYADDLVVFHADQDVIHHCRQVISDWLSSLGLELHPLKTRLTHTLHHAPDRKAGFDFLGFHIRHFPVGKTRSARNQKGQLLGFKTIIKPSLNAQRRHADRIKWMLRRLRSASTFDLIQKLSPLISGWARYGSTVNSKKVFQLLDRRLFLQLLAWAKRRHPTHSTGWVYRHYWKPSPNGRLTFSTPDASFRLKLYAQTPIRRHTKVRARASPYDGDFFYWATRLGHHPAFASRIAFLLKRQLGKCLACGLFFRDGDRPEVDHILPKHQGGKDALFNYQLLHRHCHHHKTASTCLGTQ